MIPDSFRVAESRFKILEEVLMTWLNDLRSRGIPVERKTVMAQALDIHRMLSGLLVDPLPPFSFTSGWLKGFEKRQRIVLQNGTHVGGGEVKEAMDVSDIAEEVFQQYKLNDIYVCEMTSMYLNLVPLKPQQVTAAIKTGSSAACIMLCFNASGTDKRDSLVLGN